MNFFLKLFKFWPPYVSNSQSCIAANVMRKKTLTLLSFIKKKILEYGNHHNFIKMYKINFTNIP